MYICKINLFTKSVSQIIHIIKYSTFNVASPVPSDDFMSPGVQQNQQFLSVFWLHIISNMLSLIKHRYSTPTEVSWDIAVLEVPYTSVMYPVGVPPLLPGPSCRHQTGPSPAHPGHPADTATRPLNPGLQLSACIPRYHSDVSVGCGLPGAGTPGALD